MIQDSRYKKAASGSTEVLIIPSTLSFCSVEMHSVQQIGGRAQKSDNSPDIGLALKLDKHYLPQYEHLK